MNRKFKKIIIVPLATAMAFTVPLSACTPTESEDDGTAVIINYNDGISRPLTMYAGETGQISQPSTPKREGYTFSKWSTTENGSDTVTFPYTVSEGATLYAQWQVKICNVLFDWNFEGCQNTTVEVEYGKDVVSSVIPETIENEGWQFRYWRSKKDGGSEISFPYTVKDDVTFYAYWMNADIKLYTVSFDLNYESAINTPASQTVEEGDSVTLSTPKREGYNFVGWAPKADAAESETVTKRFTPDTTCTMYAIWKKGEYTINFNRNDYNSSVNQIFTSQKVLGWDALEEPETAPTRTGYTFTGWYTSAVGGDKVEFGQPVTRGTTYYAHWKSDAVSPANNVFDAEFTEMDPNEQYPGYSGATSTVFDRIQADLNGSKGASTVHSQGSSFAGTNYYVGYMYKKGASVKFVINSTADVSGATLYATLASELDTLGTINLTTEGQYGFKITVNGTTINYGSISLTAGQAFKEVMIGNISLLAGENVIELTVNNENLAGGGTLGAVGPMVDCIRIDKVGSATLSWNPEYDNLPRKA